MAEQGGQKAGEGSGDGGYVAKQPGAEGTSARRVRAQACEAAPPAIVLRCMPEPAARTSMQAKRSPLLSSISSVFRKVAKGKVW